ncbi:MAG: sulfotransferase domain-containing protein [Gemmatimonadota bacterium]|nr:sulfotransferase domain-containing protein [Gemmatimonadota bacterium]
MRLHWVRETTLALGFGSTGQRLRRADAIVVSIPKSGRTWLRVFLRHYTSGLAGLPFALDPREEEYDVAPRIEFTHDIWENRTARRVLHRITGRHLIPRRQRDRARIVLVVRDLRDLMVSLYFELTKRGFKHGPLFEGTPGEMLRDPRFGVQAAVDTLNQWLSEWGDSGRCYVWSYEECRADPERVFREALEFLGFDPIDGELLRESIEFASFRSMKKLERSGQVDGRVLRPGDPEDPDSYKVRRGVVGGFVDYLEEADIAFIESVSSELRL